MLCYIFSIYSDTKRFQHKGGCFEMADFCLTSAHKNVQNDVWARHSWGMSTKLPKFALGNQGIWKNCQIVQSTDNKVSTEHGRFFRYGRWRFPVSIKQNYTHRCQKFTESKLYSCIFPESMKLPHIAKNATF